MNGGKVTVKLRRLAASVVVAALAAGCSGSDSAQVEELEARIAELEAGQAVATTSTTRPGRTSTTTTSTSTTTTSTTTTTTSTTTTTTVAAPQGTLAVYGSPCYGQSYPSGPCANWELKLANHSSHTIVAFVFAPPAARYTNYGDFNESTGQYATVPAETPAPVTVDVWIPAGSHQVVHLESCTSTPPPDEPGYRFSTLAPDRFEFRWDTGHTGTAAAPHVCHSNDCE